MRYFLLIGLRHGGTEPEVIATPKAADADRQWKDLVRSGEHPDFREVHLLSSTAGAVRIRKLTPADAPAPAAKKAAKK